MWAAAAALLAIIAGCFHGLLPAHIALSIAAVALSCFYAIRNPIARIAAAIGIIESLLRSPIIHACLSPLFFAACAAIPVSGKTRKTGLLIQSAPVLVFAQIILGAAYRHKAIGVMPHMAGAMLVAGLLLGIAMKVRGAAAGALSGIVLLQVSLGISVFVMRILDADSTPWFVTADVAHITVGSLTLAAATVLALVIPDPSSRAEDSKPEHQ